MTTPTPPIICTPSPPTPSHDLMTTGVDDEMERGTTPVPSPASPMERRVGQKRSLMETIYAENKVHMFIYMLTILPYTGTCDSFCTMSFVFIMSLGSLSLSLFHMYVLFSSHSVPFFLSFHRLFVVQNALMLIQ